MQKTAKIFLFIFLGSLLLWGLAFKSSPAQLVTLNEKFQVKKVDVKMSRLEVMPLDRDVKTLSYVLIDGYTVCSSNNQVVPWTQIKEGQVIRVKGGLRWDMKIRAYKIYF